MHLFIIPVNNNRHARFTVQEVGSMINAPHEGDPGAKFQKTDSGRAVFAFRVLGLGLTPRPRGSGFRGEGVGVGVWS